MLFFEYFFWHYSIALKDIAEISRNYLRATWFRFGVVFHLRTLFYPWRRQLVDDEPQEGLIMNLLMKVVTWFVDLYFRLIAALVRFSVVLTGLFACAFIILVFTVVFIVWLLWPLIFIIAMSKGIALLT